MAERLTEYDFDAKAPHVSKYPWDQWTDGSIWKVESGKDFTCKVETFRTLLTQRATDSGLSVKVRFEKEAKKTWIVFQFVPKPAGELEPGAGDPGVVPGQPIPEPQPGVPA